MPAKVLPSSRARRGSKRRRQQRGSLPSFLAQARRKLQTRRPRFSMETGSGPMRHQDKNLMCYQFTDNESSRSENSNADGSSGGDSACCDQDEARNSRSPISHFTRERRDVDCLSDISSTNCSSESYFRREYQRILQNSWDNKRSHRSPSSKDQISKRNVQPQQRYSTPSMRLCCHHMRQLSEHDTCTQNATDEQSSCRIPYQAVVSPLESSETEDEQAMERTHTIRRDNDRRLMRLAEQNCNSSNRQQCRPQQRPPQTERRTEFLDSSDRPQRLSLPFPSRSPSPFALPFVQQQQQQQPMSQQHQSQRSDKKNWIYESTDGENKRRVSKIDRIYFDDQNRHGKFRQEFQQWSGLSSHRRHQWQQQKQHQQQLEPHLNSIYSSHQTDNEPGFSGRILSRQRRENACSLCEISDNNEGYNSDAPLTDSERYRLRVAEGLIRSRSQHKLMPQQSDRLNSSSNSNHWCPAGSRLSPRQSHRETLFKCPYMKLALHAQIFECEECSAKRSHQSNLRWPRNRLDKGDLPQDILF